MKKLAEIPLSHFNLERIKGEMQRFEPLKKELWVYPNPAFYNILFEHFQNLSVFTPDLPIYIADGFCLGYLGTLPVMVSKDVRRNTAALIQVK